MPNNTRLPIAAAVSTRNWLEDDRLWVDPCPLDFLFEE